VKDQVSHPFKTTGTVIILYILNKHILLFNINRTDVKAISLKAQQEKRKKHEEL
jgi:hypothetical protein